MTLTMSRPTYGVQVGNETYSVVVTEEDWEKRKLERDRQKRLSQETNRRRKMQSPERNVLSKDTATQLRALEERKRIAEEREARKRALQLSKRRQRQTEATEKYQRAHLPPKPINHKQRPLSAHQPPPLDDVLQQLRSGSSEYTYATGSDEHNLTSTQQMNFSRAKFESKLKEEQQRILNEHRQNTQKEFHNEIESTSSSTQSSNISLIESNLSKRSRVEEQIERRHSYGQIFSNLDLMSGHTTGGYRTLSEYSTNYLSDSVAKLFVKNDDTDQSHHSSHIDLNQLQLEDADDVIQSPTVQPQVHAAADDVTIGKPTSNNVVEHSARDVTHLDDQDSLHGSSSSGTSPIANMTSFHRKYADETDFNEKVKPSVTTPPVTSIASRTSVTPQASMIQSVESTPIPTFYSTPSSHSTDRQSSVKPASPNTYPGWTQHCVTSTPQTSKETPYSSYVHIPNSYYVKSFRPSSALDNPSSGVHSAEKTLKARPKSAVLQRSSHSESHSTVQTQINEEARTNKSNEAAAGNRRSSSSFAKPSATPISALYSDAWKKQAPAQPGSTFSESKVIIPTTTSNNQATTQPVIKASRSDSALQSPAPRRESAKSVANKSTKDFSESDQPDEASKCKSILRKVSKYDAPHYHTAAVAARQKWVEHITATTHKPPTPTHNAKLHDTEVRDSLEVNRNGSGRPKSVRWHEIHYDDGTSATLADAGTAMMRRMPPAPPSVNAINRSFRSVAEKSLRSRPASGKAKSKPPTTEGDKPKKAPKGGKGRKLKVSTKLQVAMNPHPPSPTQPRVTPSKTQTNPIKSAPTGSMQSRLNDKMNEVPFTPPHRIAWDTYGRNNVTMENLKSSGSPPPMTSSRGDELLMGNNVLSKKVSENSSSPSRSESDHDASFNLNKTPTDQEINWLWDKVRSCISQRPNSRGTPISKTLSDTGSDHSLFHSSPYRPSSSTQSQQKASVVSIDGNMFANNLLHNKTRRMTRPSSAIVATAKQRLNTYNASIRRQALLQQRRNKQFASNRMKQELMATPRRYPSPRVSYFDPLPSPSGRAANQVDESTTAFLLAETLAEQNMSEEQIIRAMDSLQRKTREAQSQKSQVNPNALSTEEHRLLKSLERLNMRLHEVETAMSSNPNLNFYNHNQLHVGEYGETRGNSRDIGQRRASARY